MESIRFQLTKNDTEALKGIALCLLLIHHLFYIKNGLYDDIEVNGHGIVNSFAIVCKVCVPIFVFLSGYGLMASAQKHEHLNYKDYFVRRFSKLYINYWVIWLLFVPVGVVCFDRTFDEVYGANYIPQLIADIFGVYNIFGGYGYNPTWWFYSCIIPLYILFPFILAMSKKRSHTYIMFGISFLLCFCPIVYIQPIRFYLLTFLLGVCFCNNLKINILPPPVTKICSKVSSQNISKKEYIILILTLIIAIPFRLIVPYALMFDTVIGILIIMIYRAKERRNKYISSLVFLGKHSFNIFLFHTFIYYLYFENLIYWARNPALIFITLMAICLPISYAIEYIKSRLILKF